MEALVINLFRSKERMKFMSEQLINLNINYERIDAVDASEITNETYRKYAFNWERPLRRSELGCFLSHRKGWQKVLDENKPFIIFEDDVIIDPSINSARHSIRKLKSFKFINLETSNRKKFLRKRKEHLCEGFSLSLLLHNKSGAAAYILWPEFAEFLLGKYALDNARIADAALYDNWFIHQYQLIPAVAIQIQECKKFGMNYPFNHKSNIAYDVKPKTKLISVFKLRRIKTQIYKVCIYAFNLFSSSYEKISFGKRL